MRFLFRIYQTLVKFKAYYEIENDIKFLETVKKVQGFENEILADRNLLRVEQEKTIKDTGKIEKLMFDVGMKEELLKRYRLFNSVRNDVALYIDMLWK